VKAGLKLSPPVREAKVADRPVDGIRFVQYRAMIGGTVLCLGIFVFYFWSVDFSVTRLFVVQFVSKKIVSYCVCWEICDKVLVLLIFTLFSRLLFETFFLSSVG